MISSSEELAAYLKAMGATKSQDILDAFAAIDRADFIQPGDNAYLDSPLPIGNDQTISQPYTVAYMLDLLHAEEGGAVLDIGSGSGWTTALLAHIVGPKGSVLGLEVVPELVIFGQKNLAKYDVPHAKIQRAGKKLGVSGQTFDRILVSASAKEMPEELLDQLNENGVLVIPVQNSIWKVEKTPEGVRREEHPGFVFVPLKH